jgi:hypothetical protein
VLDFKWLGQPETFGYLLVINSSTFYSPLGGCKIAESGCGIPKSGTFPDLKVTFCARVNLSVPQDPLGLLVAWKAFSMCISLDHDSLGDEDSPRSLFHLEMWRSNCDRFRSYRWLVKKQDPFLPTMKLLTDRLRCNAGVRASSWESHSMKLNTRAIFHHCGREAMTSVSF